MNNEIILRRYHYDNDEQLFFNIHNEIDGLKNSNKEVYTLKQLIPLDRTEVLALYEHDLNKVLVQFIHKGKPLVFDYYVDDTLTVMSLTEVDQIKSIGKIEIDGITYVIADSVFTITNNDYNNSKIIKFYVKRGNKRYAKIKKVV